MLDVQLREFSTDGETMFSIKPGMGTQYSHPFTVQEFTVHE